MKFTDIDKARSLQFKLHRMESAQGAFRALAPSMSNGDDKPPVSGLLKMLGMAEDNLLPLEGPTAEKIIQFARGALLEYADEQLALIRKALVALGVEMR